MGGFAADDVALADLPQPFVLVDMVGVMFGDFHGSVGAETIDDDDFIAPGEGLQTSFDLAFLVEDDDAGRNFFSHEVSGYGR